VNVALAFSLRKSWRTGLPTDSGDGLECELASENRNASRRRRSVKSRTRGYGKFPSNLRAARLSSPWPRSRTTTEPSCAETAFDRPLSV